MNPELKDPVNLCGVILAIIGGILMFSAFFHHANWMPITGIIVWGIGTVMLIINSAQKKR